MAVAMAEQLGFDEKVIEDPELEAALDAREKRKASLAAVRAEFKTAHAVVTDKIEKLDLGDDTAVRVGRYRISRKRIEERHAEFDVNATSRLKIAVMDA